ncbi:MAG: LON peptidase substrate-binding domain-containing protein, partial [Oscillospiraceae bacterium]
MEEIIQQDIQVRVPMIALRGLVVFPKMVLHFDVARKRSLTSLGKSMKEERRVFLVSQKDMKKEMPGIEDLNEIGVVAVVQQVLKTSDTTLRVAVEGLYRAKLCQVIEQDDIIEAVVTEYPLESYKPSQIPRVEALMRAVKELFEEYCYNSPKMPPELISNVLTAEDPVFLAEYIAQNIPIDFNEKQDILNENQITNIILKKQTVSSIVETAEIISNSVVSISKQKSQFDRKLDRVLTNKITGIPIMLALLCVVFWITITGANYPSELLSAGLFWIEDRLVDFFMWIGTPSWIYGV